MERKEVLQLSKEAIAFLNFLPKKWKYIARDKDDVDDYRICVYTHRPYIEKENGNVHFKSKSILGHEGRRLDRFFEHFECLTKGKCYSIKDLLKGEKMMKNKPLLTPAEKAWLQAVIKPYRKWVVSIERHMVFDFDLTKTYLKIRFDHPKRLGFNLPILDLENSYQFIGLKLDAKYDLKTLEL